MNIVIALFFFTFFIFIIFKLPFFSIPNIKKRYVAGGFLVKLLSGAILYIIYTQYYTDRQLSDIFKYYDDSSIIYNVIKTSPGDFFRMLFGIGDDTPYFIRTYYAEMIAWNKPATSILIDNNHFIIRFNAFLRLITFGSYGAHSIIFCFIGYCGTIALVKFFTSIAPDKVKPFFWINILIPSLLIWTSGILKEAFLIFGIGMTLYSFNKIYLSQKLNVPTLLWGISGLLIMLLNKPSFFIIFTIPLSLYYLAIILRKKARLIVLLAGFGCLVLLCYVTSHFLLDINITELLIFKRNDFIRLSDTMNAQSYISLAPIENSRQLFCELPCSLWRAIRHPDPVTASNFLYFCSGIENWLYILFCAFPILFFDRKRGAQSLYLLLFIALFLVTYLTIIGFITPVAGAIVRYKSIIYPLYLSGIITLTDFQKIKEVKIHKRLFSK